MLTPKAYYSSPDKTVEFTPGEGPHSTNGKTTQISDIVTKAGGEDRDRPTDAKNTPLGQLRAQITTLQDSINEFLTARMKGQKEGEFEKKILDGDDDV